MNKLYLTEEQMDKVITMGKVLYPLYIINRTIIDEEIIHSQLRLFDDPKSNDSNTYNWLEFCILNIVPKLKNCRGTELKAFMQNIVANFEEGTRSKHPVDYLYELFKKDC